MSMTATAFREPLVGSAVAKAAWRMPDALLSALLDSSVKPGDFDDVRAQFALWANAHPTRAFPGGLAEAWDAFAAPKLHFRHPVVLLPGSPCARCSAKRFIAGSMSATGYGACSACHGTRRKPPRALRAEPSVSGMLSLPHAERSSAS